MLIVIHLALQYGGGCYYVSSYRPTSATQGTSAASCFANLAAAEGSAPPAVGLRPWTGGIKPAAGVVECDWLPWADLSLYTPSPNGWADCDGAYGYGSVRRGCGRLSKPGESC